MREIKISMQAKQKKILLITNLFPNPQEPLRGIFIYNMVKALRQQSDMIIISPLPWFPKLAFLKKFKTWYRYAVVPQKYKIDGREVLSPKYLAPPKLGVLHAFFIFISLLPLIMKLNRVYNITMLNAHWVFPDGVAVSWIAKLLRLPLVLSSRGCDINIYSEYKTRRTQIIRALRYASKVTAVSSALGKVIERLGIEKDNIEVIRNGIEFDRFNIKDKYACRLKLGLKANCRIILFVGRLIEVKGLRYLIEAVANLTKERKDLKLLIVGEGGAQHTYQRMAEELGIEEHIVFLGNKSRDEISYWYGACDAFCLPSLKEGCPNVILEALASGRPVIGANVGGIPELVNENNGILFTPRDAQALTSALSSVLDREWVARDISKTVSDFTWNRAADKYELIFKAISGSMAC